MMTLRRPIVRTALYSLTVIAAVIAAEACGPNIFFRAYLSRTLWRPTIRYVSELASGAPAENTAFVPYAGMMPTADGSTGLSRARTAYRALFPESGPTYFSNGVGPLNWNESTIASLRELLRGITPANTAEAHELDLLKCKVELRAVRAAGDPSLPQVHSCFEAYLAQPRPAALVSEARGWLARTDYLSGKGSSASKFYLGELASSASNIRRERLLASLLMIQPTEEDLEGYFDTPAHALFVANQITNSRARQSLAVPLISRLERHEELFKGGAESDALALALMRAAVQTGGPEAALRYAERIPVSSGVRKSGEYNWLVGIARFQQRDYTGAESALKNVLTSTDADLRQQTFAAHGLIGVYTKLNRPVEQLWAAFQATAAADAAVPISRRAGVTRIDPDYFYELLGSNLLGFNFDAGYLLDVQMTDAQLEEYLQRYGDAPETPFTQYPRALSVQDTVRYARAIRHARREEYTQAAEIYERLGAPRAARMRQAATLFAETRAPAASADDRLEALYNYAAFLSQNENGIFFNDSLWRGFQTSAFIAKSPDNPDPNLARRWSTLEPDEAKHYEQLEREFRDDQEEYWRAYKILNQVVEQAGHSPLGEKAAERAIVCLRRIHTGRFGRTQEIRSAELRLTRWLAQR